MRDEGQSLPRKRFTSLPLTLTSIHIFSAMLRCCVVKHLRRRFKPPRGGNVGQISRSSTAAKLNYKQCTRKRDGINHWSKKQLIYAVSDTYRLQDCHRHLKFCPTFLLCSGGAAGVCCARRRGLWLPAGAGWERGGGDGVMVGCGRDDVRKAK